MKKIAFIFIGLLLFVSAANCYAQSRDLTIILLRHAEKAAPTSMMTKDDPELSEAGRQRAARLVETIKKYRPTQIYSTTYKRTRATVTPLSEQTVPAGYKRQVQFYDHNELEAFAEQLLKTPSGTIVVVGHNTTTPTLANLLLKKEKYKYLQDNEYDKIFIIRIKGDKITDEMITY